MFTGERPIVAAVHPTLIEELKIRQRIFEEETGSPARGGLTTFSQLAAQELKAVRMSGNKISEEIEGLKELPSRKFNVEGAILDFVPREAYKKLYIFASALKRKKDMPQIRVDVSKIKGLKKHELQFF